jgi:hypothetical protein
MNKLAISQSVYLPILQLDTLAILQVIKKRVHIGLAFQGFDCRMYSHILSLFPLVTNLQLSPTDIFRTVGTSYLLATCMLSRQLTTEFPTDGGWTPAINLGWTLLEW